MSLRDATYVRGLRAIGDDLQRERLAELRQPFKGNDPALLAPTRCRVLRPFCVAGRRVEIGEVVSLEEHVARDLVFLKKVERVEALGLAASAQGK